MPGKAKLTREIMEQLMFGTGRARRFTQDSPVLPDVWLAYAGEPEGERVKLLLTPYRQSAAGDVRRELRARLAEYEKVPRVVYNQSTVAATLTFKELIRVVMPMTQWWAKITQQFVLER